MSVLPLNDRLTGPYVAIAGQTDFPADFPLIESGELAPGSSVLVIIRRQEAEHHLTVPDFAVSFVTDTGFTVVLPPCLAGDRVLIVGRQVQARLRKHTPNGAIRTATLEGDAVELAAKAQEAERDLKRALMAPYGEPGTSMPSVAARKDRLAGFNAEGDLVGTSRTLEEFDEGLRTVADKVDKTGVDVVPVPFRRRLHVHDVYLMDFVPQSEHDAILHRVSSVDQSAAAAAAIAEIRSRGGGRLILPPGNIRIDHLTADTDNLSVEGAGLRATRIDSWSTTADCMTVQPPPGQAEVFGFSINGLAFYRWGDSTGGAGLHLNRANSFVVGADVELLGGFKGLDLESCRVGKVQCHAQSDQHFPIRRDGSSLLNVRQAPGGVIPAEIWFEGNNLRGNSDNKRLDHAVLIEACDGIWFVGTHAGFCYSGGISLKPATTTTNLTAVNLVQPYLDQVTRAGLLVEAPHGYEGVFGAHKLDIAQIHDCNQAGVFYDCPNTDPVTLTIGQALKMNNHAVQVKSGGRMKIVVDRAYDINRSGQFGTGVLLEGGSGYEVHAGVRSVDPAVTPFAGVQIVGDVDHVTVGGDFDGCQNDILYASTGTDIRLTQRKTTASDARAVNAAGALDPGYGEDEITVATRHPSASGIGAIAGHAQKRVLTLTFAIVCDVYNVPANGLNLAGTFTGQPGATLVLMSRGGQWFEVSRSQT